MSPIERYVLPVGNTVRVEDSEEAGTEFILVIGRPCGVASVACNRMHPVVDESVVALHSYAVAPLCDSTIHAV